MKSKDIQTRMDQMDQIFERRDCLSSEKIVWDGKVFEVVEGGKWKSKAGCGGLRPPQPPPLRLEMIARLSHW